MQTWRTYRSVIHLTKVVVPADFFLRAQVFSPPLTDGLSLPLSLNQKVLAFRGVADGIEFGQ